jgi:hypothetical protein
MSGNIPNDRFRQRAGFLRLSSKNQAPSPNTGEFYSGYIIRRRGRNKPNRTREDPFPSHSGPSIDFPGYPKYYKIVNVTVLIPVAFPVAGPAANMATACMNR